MKDEATIDTRVDRAAAHADLQRPRQHRMRNSTSRASENGS